MLAYLHACLSMTLDGVEFVKFRPLFCHGNGFRYPADSKLRGSFLRFPTGTRDFSQFHTGQTCYSIYPDSVPIGIW
jgi:hypothetical protein